MPEVTRFLNALAQGDPHAASRLLALVADKLRKLAAERIASDNPGPDAATHRPCPRVRTSDWESTCPDRQTGHGPDGPPSTKRIFSCIAATPQQANGCFG
jgi:hypothetical protein